MIVNEKLHKLGTQPAKIRELFNYGLEQSKIVGKDKVYDYSIGNPSVPAPDSVKKVIEELINTEDPVVLHGYSKNIGFESTRAAIAENLNRRFNADADASDLMLTAGCAPALVAVAKALTVNEDTEFIAIAPYFAEYRVFFTAGGGKLVSVAPDTENFQINLAELEKSINANTAAVIINSPSNPSGVIYTRETLNKISEILRKKSQEFGRPVYIISDEPYRELAFGGIEVPYIPDIYENTIICYSWSKSLSLPGERIGYIFVPKKCVFAKEIIEAIHGALRTIGSTCPPTLIQKVIERCVDEEPDIKAYEENRNLLYNALTEMGYSCAKPDGAFYLFVKAPNGDANEFSEVAKVKHNLLVVPGDAFACPGYMRLSYCVSNTMIKNSLPAFKAMMDYYK